MVMQYKAAEEYLGSSRALHGVSMVAERIRKVETKADGDTPRTRSVMAVAASAFGLIVAFCLIVAGLNGLGYLKLLFEEQGPIILGILFGVAGGSTLFAQLRRPPGPWENPEDVVLLHPALDDTDPKALTKRVKDLQQRYSRIRRSRNHQQKRVLWYAWGAVACLIVATSLIGWKPSSLNETRVFPIGLSVLSGCIALAGLNVKRMRVRGLDEDIRNLEFEADLLNYKPSSQEQRAQKLLSINQYQLRKYYELTLAQGFWIFLVGVACLLIGLAVIAATFVAMNSMADSAKPEQQIIVGLVGAVGAILTNYVAAVYLKMHGSIASNLAAFHARLVTTNELFFANLVASRVDPPKQSDVFAQMALNITQGSRSEAPASEGAV